MDWYAGELLAQVPCMRMMDKTGRKQLYNDPSIKSAISTASNMRILNRTCPYRF